MSAVEVVLPAEDLAADDARARCDRIKKMVSVVADDIATLYEGRGWLALGYTSWAELCRVEFDGVQLAPGRRREVAGDLRGRGLSVRAIADATGTTKSTTVRDLQVSRSGTPDMSEDEFALMAVETTDDEFDTAIAAARAEGDMSRAAVAKHLPPVEKLVSGVDGKAYPATRSQTIGGRVTNPRRRPLTDDLRRLLTDDLEKVSRKANKLLADDRLPKVRGSISVGRLETIIGELVRLRDALTADESGAVDV